MIRPIFVWLHRWVGLLMTLFLVLVGVTGSLIALDNESSTSSRTSSMRSRAPAFLRWTLQHSPNARALSSRTRARPRRAADRAGSGVGGVHPGDRSGDGKPYALGFDEFYVDPSTGAELAGAREATFPKGSSISCPSSIFCTLH